MSYEVTGKIHAIRDAVAVTERMTKREFAIVTADNPKYPQIVAFELTGDRCSMLDGLREGDEVSIEFNLRGREWRNQRGEVKFFTTLSAWKVAIVGKAAPPPAAGPDDDGIPF